MLSAIIDTQDADVRLPRLLAQLTTAAVEGVVREVQIVGGPADLLTVLREETGAELAADLATAIAGARSDRILVLPAAIRLKSEWLESLSRHVRDGQGDALLEGEARGLFRPGPFGVVIGSASAQALAHPDLKGLRRRLGPGFRRIG